MINKNDLIKRAKPSVDSLRNAGLDANYVSVDSNGEVWAWQYKPQIYLEKCVSPPHYQGVWPWQCKPQICQEWWFGDKRVGGCWFLFRFDETVSNWDELCLSVQCST